MQKASLEEIAVSKLRPNPKNTRTHSKKQIRQIADSIERFGFTSPIIADEGYAVLAGHGRLEAARLLGRRTVPTVIVRDLSEAERRAYSLADNKIGENAGWDRPVLAAELSELAPLLAEAGLCIEITGFHASEVDALMGDLVDPEHDPADDAPLRLLDALYVGRAQIAMPTASRITAKTNLKVSSILRLRDPLTIFRPQFRVSPVGSGMALRES